MFSRVAGSGVHIPLPADGYPLLEAAGRAYLAAGEGERQAERSDSQVASHRLLRSSFPYSTKMVIFMLPCPEPQKLSQMVVNVPVICGVKVTSVVFPGTMSASIFKVFCRKPCFTSSAVSCNVTGSPFFNVIWL